MDEKIRAGIIAGGIGLFLVGAILLFVVWILAPGYASSSTLGDYTIFGIGLVVVGIILAIGAVKSG
jgi:preprotein translocase subunit SecD